jgi:hypothetical protein
VNRILVNEGFRRIIVQPNIQGSPLETNSNKFSFAGQN